MRRHVNVSRVTKETQISIELDIDGTGSYEINTSIPFMDHMLTLFAVHGFFDLKVTSRGDIDVDYHHTVEDLGITLGDAFKSASGDLKGINRYGSAVIPMEESLTEVHVDICNRPYLHFHCEFHKEKVGNFDTELVEEFFRAFCNNFRITMHIINRYGKNTHHQIESIFKASARALKHALSLDPRLKDNIMSSKGVL